ncbi:AEC family transporter [Brevibacillus nitrificans]|uniref:AEC family transporter n=1 Tax=Brevibacillus nitrificans TaxID=651560 RepID=UPI00286664D8|nr:AEC family transporter [Brevibacillus nitrificans]MDR7315592.1 putative permease [Brevibacillus nitrificans]
MSVFLTTSGQIIAPIVVLIGIGTILHRAFRLDMNTLSKLILYFFVPAIAFVKIYEAKLSLVLLLQVIVFLLLQFVLLLILTEGISRLFRFSKGFSASFSNSVVLTNNGNIGIPVNDLAFRHDPLAMSIQIVVVVFEILVTFTFGLLKASAATKGLLGSIRHFFRLPVLYAIILGLLCNLLQLSVPDFLWVPAKQAANGMLAIALVSIGAQIASVALKKNTWLVVASSFLRLIVSPVVAYGVITLLGLEGITAQALFIASAIPTSRNSAALALEYNNEPEFAAQAVLVSTLLSTVTLTLCISLAGSLFP